MYVNEQWDIINEHEMKETENVYIKTPIVCECILLVYIVIKPIRNLI